MRNRKWWMIIVGSVLILVALGFLLMQTAASASGDPVDLMKLVGRVTGTAIGVSFAMMVVGLIGEKAQP